VALCYLLHFYVFLSYGLNFFMKANVYEIYDLNFKLCRRYCRVEQTCALIHLRGGFRFFIYFILKIFCCSALTNILILFFCDVEKEVNSESLIVLTSVNVYIKSLPALLESQTCVICLCDFYSCHSTHLNHAEVT